MEISVGIMDNDSGYVSHNHESNFDSSSENVFSTKTKFSTRSTHDMYMSEDALLEKPSVKSYDSFDSVINCSQESAKTEFSGFDDSDRSDVSFVVPEVKTIVWDSSGWPHNPENVDKSAEDSRESPVRQTLGSHSSHKPLANVTNTHDDHTNQAVIRNVFIESNKENIDPSETPKKLYENRVNSDISPDLFDEEDDLPRVVVKQKQKSPMKSKVDSQDVKLLKRVQSSLSGVCPPPSLTIIQMSATEMLEKIEENKDLFWVSGGGKCEEPDWVSIKWPEILKYRHHGLHYNKNKISEDFEHLCSRYAERYVGVETQSTCTVFESNPSSTYKKKMMKPKWGAKSPGRRLSHLARRRITFNNATFQAGGSSSILGSRARQILVDAKKLSLLNKRSPRKSPRKTPSKSPFKIRKNTPSSSAKKKLAMRFREMSGEFESGPSTSSYSGSFKRALFSSPKQDKSLSFSGASIEKKSTKRALFSSPLKRSSPSKSPFKSSKRKRNDTEEENPAKLARSASFDIRPNLSETRSVLNRTLSDTSIARSKIEELSDQHKKKLQWAVYESLRLQNINVTHPQFKVFASVLARVTRRFLPTVRLEGRTTDKMFRIARYHSYAVVKGKSVDEIVNEYVKNRAKNQKPQGYVGPEEFQNLKNAEAGKDKENVLQDKLNILESIEKRREHAGTRSKFLSENRIDRIKKVISFEDRKV